MRYINMSAEEIIREAKRSDNELAKSIVYYLERTEQERDSKADELNAFIEKVDDLEADLEDKEEVIRKVLELVI